MANVEKDPVTGTSTTGHEWDGIKELDTPLPRWWLWTFYACIVWAIGYSVVYPAWPSLSGYTKGVWDTNNRKELAKELQAVDMQRQSWTAKFEGKSITEAAGDAELLKYAMAGGKAIFADNCQPCHGSAGSGSTNFPVLADDDWLWGGTLEDIQQTVTYGIRSGHADQRDSAMPNFVGDQILTPAQVDQVADYVLSLSGQGGDANGAGKAIFAENCVACHGEGGVGMKEMGAPKLADGIWLFGGSKAAIAAQVSKPRHGVMPSWAGRLSDVEIKQVSIYVHSLGGGQ